MTARQGLPAIVREAMAAQEADARAAFALYLTFVDQSSRIPGVDTVIRMAVRLHGGMTIEEAAAREYVYRWHLSVGQWINHTEARSRVRGVTGAFSAPHAIGL